MPRAAPAAPSVVRVEVDDERLVLRVDQVVGARRADLAHLGRARGRRERDGLRRCGRPRARRPSASASSAPRSAGRDCDEEARPPSLPAAPPTFGPAEPEAAAGGSSIARGSARDELDRRLVALLAGLAPGDEPVLLEQNGARGRVLVEQPRDPPRHVEAGPLVVEPDDLVAELLLGERAAARASTSARSRRPDGCGRRAPPGRRRGGASRSTAAAGRAGVAQRSRYVDHRRRRPSRSRSRSGSSSSSRSPGKPAAVIVARSVPEPFTQSDARLPAGVVATSSPWPTCCRRRWFASADPRRAGSSGRRARRAPPRPPRPSSVPAVRRRRDPAQDAERAAHALISRSALAARARRSAPAPRASPPTPAGSYVRRGERRAERPRAPPPATRSRRARSPGRAGFRAGSPPRARRGPDSPAASAVQAQSSSFRAPPPTTCSSSGSAPVTPREQLDRLRVLAAQGSRACSGRSRRRRRALLARPAQKSRSGAACRPAPRRPGHPGRSNDRSGGAASASSTSSVERVAPAPLPPRRAGTRATATDR